MKTKTILLLTLIMALTIPNVSSETYTESMTLRIENGVVYLDNDDDDIILNASHNVQIPVVVQFEISEEEVCQEYLVNFTTKARCDLNTTQLGEAIDSSLPQRFADQQSFFMQTVVPQQTTLDDCETQKEEHRTKSEICTDRLSTMTANCKFINTTLTTRIEEVNKDRSNWSWLMWGLLLTSLLLALRGVINKELMKRMSRKGGFQ